MFVCSIQHLLQSVCPNQKQFSEEWLWGHWTHFPFPCTDPWPLTLRVRIAPPPLSVLHPFIRLSPKWGEHLLLLAHVSCLTSFVLTFMPSLLPRGGWVLVYGLGGLWVLVRGQGEGGATNLLLAPKAVSDALGALQRQPTRSPWIGGRIRWRHTGLCAHTEARWQTEDIANAITIPNHCTQTDIHMQTHQQASKHFGWLSITHTCSHTHILSLLEMQLIF